MLATGHQRQQPSQPNWRCLRRTDPPGAGRVPTVTHVAKHICFADPPVLPSTKLSMTIRRTLNTCRLYAYLESLRMDRQCLFVLSSFPFLLLFFLLYSSFPSSACTVELTQLSYEPSVFESVFRQHCCATQVFTTSLLQNAADSLKGRAKLVAACHPI